MDRLTALTVFRQVAERGSFAEAGRFLRLSAAAISKNVAELEAHLGVRLIHRTTRRMHLTEAGQSYLETVQQILDTLAEADRALGPVQAAPQGTLRVTAPMTVGLTWLSAVMPDFLRRYPDLRLDLNLDDRRVDLVRDGYDVALRGSDSLEDSSLTARRLATLDHVLCGAPAYWAKHGVPARPGDLRGHECLRFSLSGHADQWTFHKHGEVEQVKVQGRYSVASSLAVRDALVAGFGVSLIPRAYVRSHLQDGRLVAALEDWRSNETTLFAVYPSRRHVAPKLRVFLDFLAETFAEVNRQERKA